MSEIRFRLYGEVELQPVVERMARELAALLGGEAALLVGLLRRGAPLADRLAAVLAGIPGAAGCRRLDLGVKRYGDDLTLLHPETSLEETPAQAGMALDGQTVVLVDDVLYQGHSLARVLEWARSHGAARVLAVVLVDRRAGRLPLVADVAGLRLQIAPRDVIECNVPPYEHDFAVDLLRLADGTAG
jgi:pyrimidine operon attenuation protein / uracil phosphoribosyltransferase